MAVVTAAAIVAGTVVTGAGPHAGDEDVGRYDVPIADAARVHGVLVLIAVALAVVLGIRLQRHAADRRVLQGVLSSWIFVALLQAAIGYIQYFNDVPALLVGIHVAGATALWAMTVWLVLATAAPEPRRRRWTPSGRRPVRSRHDRDRRPSPTRRRAGASRRGDATRSSTTSPRSRSTRRSG